MGRQSGSVSAEMLCDSCYERHLQYDAEEWICPANMEPWRCACGLASKSMFAQGRVA